MTQGDLDTAEPLLREALDIRAEVQGVDHPEFATTLSSLAALLWHRGDLEVAGRMLRQAYLIRRRALGADHPRTIASRASLNQFLERTAETFDPRDSASPRASGFEHDSEPLLEDMAVLSDIFNDLGTRLIDAGRGLQESGKLPFEGLESNLNQARNDFRALCDRSLALALLLGVECPAEHELGGLVELGLLLEKIAEAEIRRAEGEEARQRALAVLDRILALAPPTGPSGEAVREFQIHTRRLHASIASARWNALPPETERIAEGEHPLAHLLALVENVDELSTDARRNLHRSIADAFGTRLVDGLFPRQG